MTDEEMLITTQAITRRIYEDAMSGVIAASSDDNDVKTSALTCALSGVANAHALVAITLQVDRDEHLFMCVHTYDAIAALHDHAAQHLSGPTLH